METRQRTRSSSSTSSPSKAQAEITPEKKRLRSSTSDRESGSDDELLPAFSSPRVSATVDNCKQFKQGDVVWAKFMRYPFWPAIIWRTPTERKTAKKNQRFSVCFLDEHFTFESKDKTAFNVAPKRIRPYFCDASLFEELKEEAANYSEHWSYSQAHSMLEDYLRHRALGKITSNFWKLQQEHKKTPEEGSLLALPTDNNDAESCHCTAPCSCQKDADHCEDNGNDDHSDSCDTNKNDRYDETSEDHEQLTLASFLPSRRNLSKRRAATMLPYVESIKEMKSTLIMIANNDIHSERHKMFESGSEEKRRLKFNSSLGPLDGEDAQDEVFGLLLSWYQTWFPESKYDPVSYVADVWLPEAIIRAIQKQKGCSYKQAERVYLR